MKKTVIITGSTKGIGKATALAFGKKGYHVIVTSRNSDRKTAMSSELEQSGISFDFYELDITDEKAVERMIKKVTNQHGKLDVMVNNAGIAGDNNGLLADASTENFNQILDTNVKGVFYGMKYAIQSMLNTNGGVIVNLASIAGLNGIPYAAQYCATKHAVVGLTKSAAVEYATSGIRINAVAPGGIKTEILQSAIEAGTYSEESIAAMHPMNQMGKVEDIAHAITFLASGECSFMTGSVLSVDGGFNAA